MEGAHEKHFTPPQPITIPGQSQPMTIDVYTHVRAQNTVKTAETLQTDDGFMIRAGNCRNPHIVQFIYREKIGLDGQLLGGTYTRSNGQSYSLTTDDATPSWHTDSVSARDAYYETQPGVPVITNALGLTFFDQPSFAGTDYLPGASETWKAVFKTYVICNCQVISEVKWTRQVRWTANTSATPTIGTVSGTQSAPEYVNVSVVPPDDPNFDWMNQQLLKDGLAPVP